LQSEAQKRQETLDEFNKSKTSTFSKNQSVVSKKSSISSASKKLGSLKALSGK